jgi:outer membrane protein assembly factor BamB
LVARGLDGALSSLSPRNGAARWTVATAVKGDLPALVADDVFVVAGEGLSAVEAATGRVLWSLPPDAVATAPPVLVGTCLLVGEGDGTLRCRDPKTGASRWTYRTGSALLAPPVADAEGHIVVGTTDRRILASTGRGRCAGASRWRRRANAAAARKLIFVARSTPRSLSPRGNGCLAWRVHPQALSPPLPYGA